MNGRIYDPTLARFLSPDPYVQAPDFSQSFNRYAYCWNNPFKYTDPTGEIAITTIAIITGAIIGAYLGGMAANSGELNPVQWDWQDPTTYLMMGVGAIIGAVAGYGIAAPGSIVFSFGLEVATPWISAGIGVTSITATGASSDWNFQWSTSAGGGGNVPVNGKKETKQEKKNNASKKNNINKSHWIGSYFQGTEKEAQDMLIDLSKRLNLETAYWSTSKGYYFEPIQGDAYGIEYSVIYNDIYNPIPTFNVKDYNKSADYKTNDYKTNDYKTNYRYTPIDERNGTLYLNPNIFERSRIYSHAHTHPRNSMPSTQDILHVSYLMKIRGRVYGWNGTIYDF